MARISQLVLLSSASAFRLKSSNIETSKNENGNRYLYLLSVDSGKLQGARDQVCQLYFQRDSQFRPPIWLISEP